MSQLEYLFDVQCRNAGIELERELQVIPGRRFRFDRGSRAHRLLIEIHGGTWTRGRHTRGGGFTSDREKMNLAQLQGWRVLEFCRCHVEDGRALEWTKEALRCHQSV